MSRDGRRGGAEEGVAGGQAAGQAHDLYGEGHGHPVPSMVHEVERPVFLKRIADHLRRINPEFIVMTEGLYDCAL